MTELFLEILNRSVSASWLVLAVVLLRLTLKRIPKWINVLLWGLVAIRLLCPFTPESSLSLVPQVEPFAPTMRMELDTPQTATAILADPPSEAISTGTTYSPALPATETTPLTIVPPAAPESQWDTVATAVWLVGIAAMSLYTAASYLRLRHRVRMAIRVKGNIYISEFVSSPFVLGIRKPRIYLPYHMNEQDRRHVIAHERSHIRRRDHWWKPLGFLLLTLHWFNPLMWLAYILLCRDIELACDERVIREMGTQQRADYSQALLHCSVTHRAIAACPLAFGEVGVKERVRNVLRYQKPAFWLVLISIALCAILAVCFLTDPKSSDRDKLLSILREEAYYINAQTVETLNVGIAKSRIPEACFTPEGHTFGDNEILLYNNGGSTMLLRHICLDEDPNRVRITYEFTYSDLPESGKLLMPYSVPKPNGRAPAVENYFTGEHILMEDLSTVPGLGTDDPITATVSMDASLLRPQGDVISLEVGDLKMVHYTAKALPVSLLGTTWQVDTVAYADPRYSSTWTQLNTPYCAVTQDCHLLTMENEIWQDRGKLEVMELTGKNFDDLFYDFPNSSKLRKNNQQAWELRFADTHNTYLLYLLRQENNDLYIAYGYSDADSTVLRWLLELSPCDETDWTLSMSLFHISRTRAHMDFRLVGAIPNGQLSTGRYYDLQVWNGSDWAMLPSLTQERVFTTEAIVITPDSYAWDVADWSDDYGPLPDGRYRLRKLVTLTKPDGTTQDRFFHAEFTIGGSAQDYVQLTLEDISPTGATLLETVTREDPPQIIYGDLWMEHYADGQWSYLVPTTQLEPIFAEEKRNLREMISSDGIYLDWSHLYGQLPQGRYRVVREFTILLADEAEISTACVEFTTGSDLGITLMADRVTDTGASVTFLADESVQEGELFFAGAGLQYADTGIYWEDVLPLKETTESFDLALPNAGINLLWDQQYQRFETAKYRILIRVRQVHPDGTEELHTLYEYFSPDDYAWGITMAITEISPDAVDYVIRNSKALSDGTVTLKDNFTVQRRANNQWEDLNVSFGDPNRPDSPIPATGGSGSIGWEGALGELPNGTYRLVRYVARHYPDGDTEVRPIYAVFGVDGTPELPQASG